VFFGIAYLSKVESKLVSKPEPQVSQTDVTSSKTQQVRPVPNNRGRRSKSGGGHFADAPDKNDESRGESSLANSLEPNLTEKNTPENANGKWTNYRCEVARALGLDWETIVAHCPDPHVTVSKPTNTEGEKRSKRIAVDTKNTSVRKPETVQNTSGGPLQHIDEDNLEIDRPKKHDNCDIARALNNAEMKKRYCIAQ
jgi:hypothetical protein